LYALYATLILFSNVFLWPLLLFRPASLKQHPTSLAPRALVVFIIIFKCHAHKQAITCTTRTPPCGTSSLIPPGVIIFSFGPTAVLMPFSLSFHRHRHGRGPCRWSRPWLSTLGPGSSIPLHSCWWSFQEDRD